MATKDLAQGETIELELVRMPYRSPTVSIGTSISTAAGAVFVIDIMKITNEWIEAIGLFDGLTQAKVNSITGASQWAWTDCPGVQRARVRRTDATGGNGTVDIDYIGA